MIHKKGVMTPLGIFGVVVLTMILYSIVNVVAIEPYFSYSVETYEDCNGLALIETSMCLKELVETNYKYVERGDDIKPWEDIVQNGGDCYDYNVKYAEWGVALGYNSYSYRICPFGDSLTCHRVAIINDETGYCLLDQTNTPSCFIYGTEEESQNI